MSSVVPVISVPPRSSADAAASDMERET